MDTIQNLLTWYIDAWKSFIQFIEADPLFMYGTVAVAILAIVLAPDKEDNGVEEDTECNTEDTSDQDITLTPTAVGELKAVNHCAEVFSNIVPDEQAILASGRYDTVRDIIKNMNNGKLAVEKAVYYLVMLGYTEDDIKIILQNHIRNHQPVPDGYSRSYRDWTKGNSQSVSDDGLEYHLY